MTEQPQSLEAAVEKLDSLVYTKQQEIESSSDYVSADSFELVDTTVNTVNKKTSRISTEKSSVQPNPECYYDETMKADSDWPQDEALCSLPSSHKSGAHFRKVTHSCTRHNFGSKNSTIHYNYLPEITLGVGRRLFPIMHVSLDGVRRLW